MSGKALFTYDPSLFNDGDDDDEMPYIEDSRDD